MQKVGVGLFSLVLACGAGGGDDGEPPCTFDGSYLMPYTLVSGDPSSCPSVAPRVTLVESNEQACTTSCSFADGPCETTFTCAPGNPVLECSGTAQVTFAAGAPMRNEAAGCTASLCPALPGICVYELRLQRLAEE